MKQRARMTAALKRQLFLEAGYRCAMLRCNHEDGLDVHHIDADPSNNSPDNLVVLCAVHHRMATVGRIDAKTCRMLKEILAGDTQNRRTPEEVLGSRREYVSAAMRLLADTQTYRATVVGPLFLHPKWWADRRALRAQLPDYEGEVMSFLNRKARHRTHDIRLILRNTKRYRDKVEQFVEPIERRRFIEEVLEATARLWGENGQRGPDLCCIDTGHLRVELIFDRGVIASYRASPNSPITGGKLETDPEAIRYERGRFDAVFDGSTRGQEAELNELRRFVRGLWVPT